MDKIKVSTSEVLRYLGYKGQEIDRALMEKINKIREESISYFRPREVVVKYKIKKEDGKIIVENTGLILEGKDIYKLLEKVQEIYILAVTLGNDIERLTRRYEKISMTKALILDACATTAVEEVCDSLEERLRKDLKEGENFTFRYSPGYGDLTLDVQRDIINVLNAEKLIGLKVSESNLLFPRKSVTAILGITREQPKKKSCLNCKNYKNCMFRREGDISGCS